MTLTAGARARRDDRPAAHVATVTDFMWEWWTRPPAVQLANGDIWYAGLSKTGQPVVAKAGTRVALTALAEVDDHNAPALLTKAGKAPLLFYTRHDMDVSLRYRVASATDDPSAWGAESTIAFAGNLSYAQAHYYGDEVFVFSRDAVNKWSVVRSTGWGTGWQAPVAVLNPALQCYLSTVLLADGQTLRCALTGHPYSSTLHDVYVCEIDLASGDITLPGSATVKGNIRTGVGLPLTTADMQLAYSATGTRRTNLFDVGSGPEFEIILGDEANDSTAPPTDAKYRYVVRHNGAWVVNDVVAAGTIFGYTPAGMYLGGAAIPNPAPGGTVFVSRERGGIWYIEKRTTTDQGATWATTVLAQSTRRLVRPRAIKNRVSGPEVGYLAVNVYPDVYTIFDTDLVAA